MTHPSYINDAISSCIESEREYHKFLRLRDIAHEASVAAEITLREKQKISVFAREKLIQLIKDEALCKEESKVYPIVDIDDYIPAPYPNHPDLQQ